MSWPTFIKRNLIHSELLREVARRASEGVLEVGIGSGAQSAFLSRQYETTAVDNSPRILAAAVPNLRRFGSGVEVVGGDAFALPFGERTFGVAVSQGLFEHFTDNEVVRLVKEQLRVATSVVFSVPSDHYPRQDVGDERLMGPEQWALILQKGLPQEMQVRARYYRLDLERWKYSVLAMRDLGSFNVLVTVDRI